ncbi:hypothetical protein PRK78_005920 [Emydomyces testavorans]|uniref:C2H2-type domain-containing protein n=1 Tax=Emydomyces testavorans TaxID=2070801 RepID=A0AAF0IN32_9EURO|nr:hypothetical protein PRK78_005920 [Emydomyces testavorans]
MLDFQLAPSIAQFNSQSLPLNQHWKMPRTTRALANQPESMPNSLSKDIALSIRRQRELLETGPVTYTPATHRISKAKKGKRVHLCQFPGCNKVFTRAEHRRRHELNHNPQASFVCSVEGCGKGFHRHDLLARHMEKHDSQTQTPKPSPSRRRQNSHASTLSDTKTASAPTSISDHRLTPVPHPIPTAPSASITPPTSIPSAYGGDFSGSFWDQTAKSLEKSHTVPYTHVDELVPFSSPASSRSASYNSSPFQVPSQFPVIEQFPEAVFAPQLTASPSLMAAYPEWTPLEAAVNQPLEMLPTTPFEGDIPQTVAVPGPLSSLDGVEWFALRRELTSAPGVISGNDGMAIIDLAKWQDCLECYWQYFHPLFPIIHRSSFFATKPSPLLAGAMVAIGSQYDCRPNSREYSLALLEACQKILSKRGPITSRSRISDIQAVFLLEILSKYRSRRADVKVSHRLRSLYGSFIQDSHWASQNPLAAYHSLSQTPSVDDVRKAHKFWVEHETRRRVLQAAFILEVQQSLLFQQPLATFLQSNLDPVMREHRISPKVDLPFPCSSELWESSNISQWTKHAKSYESLVSSSVRERVIQSTGSSGVDLDPFQASLIFSQTLPNTSELEDKMDVFVEKAARKSALDGNSDNHSSRSSYIQFMYHALLAAKHVPLQALLTVSGESWLFNRKVSETEFQAANERVQAWVSNSEEVRRAFWHAIHVLRYTVNFDELNMATQVQRRASVDQYSSHLNSRFPNPRPSTNPQEHGANVQDSSLLQTTTTTFQHSTGPLTMLQANWILYICTLICWTYENRTYSSTHPITTNPPPPPTNPLTYYPISVQEYTSTSLFPPSSPSPLSLRQFLDHTALENIPSHDLTAVLEHIRLMIVRNAGGNRNGGGLLKEAERVLMRLIEMGRQQRQQHHQHQRLQHFQVQHQHQHSHSHLHQPAWEFINF